VKTDQWGVVRSGLNRDGASLTSLSLSSFLILFYFWGTRETERQSRRASFGLCGVLRVCVATTSPMKPQWCLIPLMNTPKSNQCGSHKRTHSPHGTQLRSAHPYASSESEPSRIWVWQNVYLVGWC